MPASIFIKSPTPKAEIIPNTTTIRKILSEGWVGQIYWLGHWLQLHIPASRKQSIIVYNRQGQPYGNELPDFVLEDLEKFFSPLKGWNALVAKWVPAARKLHIFDMVKKDGIVLSHLGYKDRWSMIPRVYPSKSIVTAKTITTVEKCLEVVNDPNPKIAGLVFHSQNSTGFNATSVIRCRKNRI